MIVSLLVTEQGKMNDPWMFAQPVAVLFAVILINL